MLLRAVFLGSCEALLAWFGLFGKRMVHLCNVGFSYHKGHPQHPPGAPACVPVGFAEAVVVARVGRIGFGSLPSACEVLVHSFADQIMELDDLIRATRNSRLGSQSTVASTIKRLSSTGTNPALAS